VSYNEKEKIIEAALFMSPKPLDIEKLNEMAQVESRVTTKAMLLELKGLYDSKDSALEIVESPAGFQMRVREAYQEKVKHFATESIFSKSVMKTLAIIAYKQPIAQSQVILIRNNKAYDHLKILLENGFIKKEPKGRTYVLTTTQKFLEYFGRDFSATHKKTVSNVHSSSGTNSSPTITITSVDSKKPMEKEINQIFENNP
jgi:segregation and condensation protein B